MRRSDELQEALRLLAERHQTITAPAALEGRLREAVRATANTSAGPWIRWRIPAAAAAAVLALLLIRSRQPANSINPPDRVRSFVVLPAAFGLPAPAATTIIRVELRKGDLRLYGFDVPPPVQGELVHADFVVGQDGLARAVRIVE